MNKHILKTDRLRLRLFTKDDVDNLYWLYTDKETMKFFQNIPDREGVKDWIKWDINHHNEHRFGFWAVELKENQKFIGRVGYFMSTISDEQGERDVPEIAWIIHRDFWKQGYATEASLAILEYAFKELKIKTMYTTVDPENVASVALIKKLGLTYQKDVLERGVVSPSMPLITHINIYLGDTF